MMASGRHSAGADLQKNKCHDPRQLVTGIVGHWPGLPSALHTLHQTQEAAFSNLQDCINGLHHTINVGHRLTVQPYSALRYQAPRCALAPTQVHLEKNVYYTHRFDDDEFGHRYRQFSPLMDARKMIRCRIGCRIAVNT